MRHFSGVGAHNQLLVERYIQNIFNMSRSMMVHFAMHWSQVADTNLWPFAVDQAIYIWNRIPDSKTRLAPANLFASQLHFGNNDLQRLHFSVVPAMFLTQNSKMERRFQNGLVTVVVPSISVLVDSTLLPFI